MWRYITKNFVFGLKKDDRGVSTVEIILICVVLIGLVLLFKNEIGELIESLFGSMGSKAEEIIS